VSARAVIVTGASSGIGAAIAGRAAAQGWSVAVGYHQGVERAAAVVKGIEALGGRAKALRLGLGEAASLGAAIEGAAALGDVEALVLAAAPTLRLSSFLKTSPAEFREQFEVQAIGNQALLAAVWKRYFRPRGGGHVVAILSAAAEPPVAGHMTAYVAAKTALRGVLQSAVAELGPSGLAATEILPGAVDTPMLAALGERVRESFARASPQGRLLTPEAVADTVLAALADPPTEPTIVRRVPIRA
jgi:3-oxoacyl-[acyl-carrier protein] reductase